jgi:nitrile hydratase accessory protein
MGNSPRTGTLMTSTNTLGDLASLPRDHDGPVFSEPWQAQAFAVVIKLIEFKRITQKEWASRLAAVLQGAEKRGSSGSPDRYYDHWLQALEELLVEKNFADWADLASEKETIRESDHHRREHQLLHNK